MLLDWSIGIAFSILIYLFVKDEGSFDRFHTQGKDIYRIEEFLYDVWDPDPEDPYNQSAYLQLGLALLLKEDLPEVKYATRFNGNWEYVVKHDQLIFTENVSFVDNDFFRMFSFDVLAGNADKFLESPTDVVITRRIAEKYFGNIDALGKVFTIDTWEVKDYVVVGVVEDPPTNSSINFEILISQVNRPYYTRNLENWRNFSTPTFVQLHEGADKNQLKAGLISTRDKLMKEYLLENKKQHNIPDDVIQFEYRATNLYDIHLHKDINWYKVSDAQYSYILSGLAILIIIIAAINYISLALTTSASRRKEVGVRKAIGANQSQLTFQFTFESILVALISMFIGIGLMYIFLPSFNEFTDKSITLNATALIEIGAPALLLSSVIGLLAGSYPSIILSRFSPVKALKGGGNSVKVKARLAKPLVLLQFTLSSILIISAFVMYQQMYFISTKDLGFSKESVLVVPMQLGWNKDSDLAIERMKMALSGSENILEVGGTNNSFAQGWSRYGYEIDGENKVAYVWSVDEGYIPTLEIELVEGRNFDPTKTSDSTALIVNEALVADMGWENPLEEYLNWREDSASLGFKIIGVAKDYNFRSLESEVDPMLLTINRNDGGHLMKLLVKIKPGKIPEAMEYIETQYKQIVPDKPFEYTFLDEDVDKQYSSFNQWMKIMGFSTLFAILISTLGLFGLAGINAVNKTKEIGIRKVFGAPLMDIFLLLNRQYVWLAVLSFTCAAPLAWYVMDSWWLVDFKYRIELGWQLFLITFILGLAITVITVSYHGIKAASINPAKTLKYE